MTDKPAALRFPTKLEFQNAGFYVDRKTGVLERKPATRRSTKKLIIHVWRIARDQYWQIESMLGVRILSKRVTFLHKIWWQFRTHLPRTWQRESLTSRIGLEGEAGKNSLEHHNRRLMESVEMEVRSRHGWVVEIAAHCESTSPPNKIGYFVWHSSWQACHL